MEVERLTLLKRHGLSRGYATCLNVSKPAEESFLYPTKVSNIVDEKVSKWTDRAWRAWAHTVRNTFQRGFLFDPQSSKRREGLGQQGHARRNLRHTATAPRI